MKRRQFLELSSLSASLLAIRPKRLFKSADHPIMVSTWDDGKAVNVEGWKTLSGGGRAIDAVENGCRYMEDQQNCCVGLGGNPDRDGHVTLDSCIMDEKANCGAVADIERIKHPVSVARKVMELTPHILLVADGAQQFALENGFKLEPDTLSEPARKAYKDWLKESKYNPEINIENKENQTTYSPMRFKDGSFNHDTMGTLAIDASGDMSGAVTTSGMAFKMRGRVGDSPIIGAGLFVDNEIGAATSSGLGEEVIRICGTHTVVELMRMGYTPEMACKKTVQRIIDRDPERAKGLQVGFLALGKDGTYGAYAVQKGFVFAVKSKNEERIIPAKYFYDYGVS